MYYDIPGITTSVTDYSVITPSITGGRIPLIAGPCKFGKEDLMEFTDAKQVKQLTGGPKYQKYGLALNYVLGALTVTGNVLFKRLLPSDATFANIGIEDNNGKYISKSYAGITDKLAVQNLDNNVIIHYAKDRGEGYNEFYIKYDTDLMSEKIYSDEEGESKYKYNFLRATIYQVLPDGIQVIAGPITVSIIDNDPKNNNPIVDVSTGETLFINDRIESKNSFINIKLSDKYLNDMKNYLSIEDLIKEKNTPEVILKDINGDTNYKIKADSNNNIYTEATSQEGMDQVILKYYSSGAWNYEKLYVENKEFKHESTTDVDSDTPTYEKLYIIGDLNFNDMYIDSDSKELIVEEFKTVRSEIYKKLLNQKWNFENGFDGKNLHINGLINFNGTSEEGKENVKELLMNFFNENEDIREVMFPKYKFNYVVDWTTDLDVINSIINLTDSTGRSLGIMSGPLSFKADDDYELRTEKLYQSSYNNALYPGEWNLKHYDSYSGKNIAMPLSYYMMIQHLKIDNEISITEPVAGIVKGQMPVSGIEFSYIPKTKDIEKLRRVQINTIIKETDGIYSIDQLTMYKKASKLSRINVVKVIQQMRVDLPQLLKPFIQTKETNNNVGAIKSIVDDYMSKWEVVSGSVNPDEIFKKVNTNIIYIPEEYKLIVSIKVVPIGTIEKIDIPIIVEKQG